MSGVSSRNPRLAALNLLAFVLDSGGNLSDADTENRLDDPRDRAFARHLAYGALRWLSALDWLSSQMLRKPLKRKDRDVHRLVLIGLWQLWKGDTAPHAAIHETAEAARTMGKPWAVSLVNAVLRRFQRERDDWLTELQKTEERFAHPAWLLAVLKSDWPDDWEAIAHANNRAGPLWLRMNARFEIGETIEGLQNAGFEVDRHATASEAARVNPSAPVHALPGFASGRISVQDPAAQLAVSLLGAEDQHRVLDACAAPGGKTGHLLERVPGIRLTAIDQSASRIDMIRENLQRLGLAREDSVKLLAADAAEPDDWWDRQPYDRILLDAPCTATGVIRRHPEIKWLRTPAQVESAVRLQARLLERLWPLLRPGGILLYATCSVLRDENERQIRRFLEAHPEADPAEIELACGHGRQGRCQILPGEEEMDGFFYARMLKES